MKFVKGVMFGTMVSVGAIIMYKETMGGTDKRMIKKGRISLTNT